MGPERKTDVRVAAAELWNSSKFHVRKGCGIRIRVKPDSKWVDWFIKSGPEGYDRFWLRPFKWTARVPDADWFTLVCCIDRDLSSAFIVGPEIDCYIPSRDGELYFFANDAPFAYWNNKGHVEVEIEETDCKWPNQLFPHGALDFKKAYGEEMGLIQQSRSEFGAKDNGGSSPSAICISGGGIRSATFSFGCLQTLDRNGLLRSFDYLSTVSGGGYIGSWLSALIATHPLDKLPAGRSLLNSETAKNAIDFLRDNSSYLTPRNGIFSGDTWSLITIFCRNLALNWLMILPLIGASLIFLRALVLLSSSLSSQHLFWLTLLFGALALIYPIFVSGSSDVPQASFVANGWPRIKKFWMEPTQFVWGRAAPLSLTILSLSLWYFAETRQATTSLADGYNAIATKLAIFTFGTPAAALFVYGLIAACLRLIPLESVIAKCAFAAIETVASFGAVSLTLLIANHLLNTDTWFFIWFPFLAAMIFLGVETLFAGLTDPVVEDEDREWWARSAGYVLMIALGWSAGALLSIALPDYVNGHWSSFISRTPFHNSTNLGLAGLVSGIVAFISRNESRVAEIQKGLAAVGEIGRKCVFGLSMTLFVMIVVSGLAIGTLQLTHLIGSHLPAVPGVNAELVAAALVGAGLLLFSVAISIPVNINHFSSHIAYRNRLVRTFLGASNLPRSYNPFTGFSSKDNVLLHALIRSPLERDRKEALNQLKRPKEPILQRPFHVLCGAANLATGEKLAWQERKAVSFTFSGLHCGSSELGYRDSAQFGGPRGISLGTAMTISAAAANSGMGFYSSPLKSFLLTLLNARLGWWLGNPSHVDSWKRDSPLLTFGPLIAELFSLTNRRAKFVNLSDGGHFDNTSVYEMIKRRCGRILLIDADTTLSGMTNLSMRARVDLDTNLERKKSPADQPWEEYAIHYPQLNGDPQFGGTLIRMFPKVCESSSFDSIEYKRVNKDFPGTSIVDQFFAERTFEAYRRLGMDAMESCLKKDGSQGLDLVFGSHTRPSGASIGG